MQQKRPQMTGKKIIVRACLLIVLLFFLFVLHTCSGGFLSPLPYRHLDSFRGKVIDADTKEPIAGAAVLAVYEISVPSIAGEMGGVEDGQEALTDGKGEFEIPATTRWFVAHRGYARGSLTIFKPGYGVFPDHPRSEAVGVNKSWPPSKRYIVYELPKLKTWEERKSVHINTYSEIPYEKKKNYIRLYNEERINLGYSPTKIIPKEGE